MTRVDTTVTGSVMTITLNGPERMNSLSPETRDGLETALDTAESDDSLSSLVITACTPGRRSARDVSIERIRACGCGERFTAPKSIRGR